LDPAANVTVGASSSAPEDAMDVDRKRPADWPHWPDRGNGAGSSDRLEHRLFRDTERAAELVRAQETIRQIEKAAAEKAAEIERLEQAVAGIESLEPQPVARGFLVFVWTPKGYALREGEGESPAAGNRLNVDGVDHAVAKLGRSPLPGDARRCAYLQPV